MTVEWSLFAVLKRWKQKDRQLAIFYFCLSFIIPYSLSHVFIDINADYLEGNKYLRIMTIFAKFCTCKKYQNNKNTKLNTCQVWDSLFPNIWSKYDIDTCILHISINSYEIRVSVTYLIPITLISVTTERLIFKGTFVSFFNKIAKLNTHEIFCNHQMAKLSTCKM